MKIRFLNKTIENKRFEYTPMYYDEKKEALDKKKELYRRMKEDELSESEKREMLREEMRQSWSRTNYRKSQEKASNIRILILVLVFLALGYFIFNGVDEVDTIVEKIW
ncbi:MAG: hypothetical protein ACO2Z9_01045 [Crocinitomicaceae bacterium]